MVRVAIESFLETARQPVLIEPGEDPLDILPDKFVLGSRGGLCTLECWNETRNLVRRIRAISKTRRGFLELEVEHFGGRTSNGDCGSVRGRNDVRRSPAESQRSLLSHGKLYF